VSSVAAVIDQRLLHTVVTEVFEEVVRLGVGEFSVRGAAGGDADDLSADGAAGTDIEGGVADNDHSTGVDGEAEGVGAATGAGSQQLVALFGVGAESTEREVVVELGGGVGELQSGTLFDVAGTEPDGDVVELMELVEEIVDAGMRFEIGSLDGLRKVVGVALEDLRDELIVDGRVGSLQSFADESFVGEAGERKIEQVVGGAHEVAQSPSVGDAASPAEGHQGAVDIEQVDGRSRGCAHSGVSGVRCECLRPSGFCRLTADSRWNYSVASMEPSSATYSEGRLTVEDFSSVMRTLSLEYGVVVFIVAD